MTMSDDVLCGDCFERLGAMGGGGVAVGQGGSMFDGIVGGVAAGKFPRAAATERQAAEKRRAKLARTTGFWRRLWVRIVG